MSIKNRIKKLEDQTPPASGNGDSPESTREQIIVKLNAAAAGESLPVSPMTPGRAEIARRLDRIAETQTIVGQNVGQN